MPTNGNLYVDYALLVYGLNCLQRVPVQRHDPCTSTCARTGDLLVRALAINKDKRKPISPRSLRPGVPPRVAGRMSSAGFAGGLSSAMQKRQFQPH